MGQRALTYHTKYISCFLIVNDKWILALFSAQWPVLAPPTYWPLSPTRESLLAAGITDQGTLDFWPNGR